MIVDVSADISFLIPLWPWKSPCCPGVLLPFVQQTRTWMDDAMIDAVIDEAGARFAAIDVESHV